jgi:hypothetical protein
MYMYRYKDDVCIGTLGIYVYGLLGVSRFPGEG